MEGYFLVLLYRCLDYLRAREYLKKAESLVVGVEDRELIRAAKKRGGASRVKENTVEQDENIESIVESLVSDPVRHETPARDTSLEDLCSESDGDQDLESSPLDRMNPRRKSMIPTRMRQVVQSPLVKKFGSAQRYVFLF
jgi:hypothetical protein